MPFNNTQICPPLTNVCVCVCALREKSIKVASLQYYKVELYILFFLLCSVDSTTVEVRGQLCRGAYCQITEGLRTHTRRH